SSCTRAAAAGVPSGSSLDLREAACLAGGGRLALLARQLHLPQAHITGSYFDAFVVAEELQRLLQREQSRWDQPDELVRGGRAHVGELLLLGRVDVEILGARILSHNHSLVDLGAGRDEQLPALLQVEQGESRRRAAALGDETARRPHTQIAVPRLVSIAE